MLEREPNNQIILWARTWWLWEERTPSKTTLGERQPQRGEDRTQTGRVDKSLWRAVLACKHVRIEKRSGEKSSLY